MRDLRIASSCLTMRAIALGYAHGEEDCPLRHKYMFAAPGKVAYLDCLIVIHGVFKTGVAFSARARYVWPKIRAPGCSYWFRLPLQLVFIRFRQPAGQTFTIFQALALGLTRRQNE